MDSPMPDSRSYARAWGALTSTLWAWIRRVVPLGGVNSRIQAR